MAYVSSLSASHFNASNKYAKAVLRLRADRMPLFKMKCDDYRMLRRREKGLMPVPYDYYLTIRRDSVKRLTCVWLGFPSRCAVNLRVFFNLWAEMRRDGHSSTTAAGWAVSHFFMRSARASLMVGNLN